MKWTWILLLILLIYCGSNDSTSSISNSNTENFSSTTANTRLARTFQGFSSEEDDDDDNENGIHLHIWNDIANKKNFYPNLFSKHVAEESVNTVSKENNPAEFHINLNDLLPTPQPQMSAANLLKNALVHTLALDEYRKSDQNLYGAFYKLKPNHQNPNSIGWNYHPSAVNYIPKPYNTNLDDTIQSTSTKSPKPLSPNTLRPTLREQILTTHSIAQDYYTNLRKNKEKSVFDSAGYEIGGIPKYSGRLLANEPMPQPYRTFKMFEPVPRQIMLPPSSYRIPDFKPVPPRLKIVPVIDELLDGDSQLSRDIVPWQSIRITGKLKPNYFIPVMPKELQIIPFSMVPSPNYDLKTEYGHLDHHAVQFSDVGTLQNVRVATNEITPLAISTNIIQAPDSDSKQINNSIYIYAKHSNDLNQTEMRSNQNKEQNASNYDYKNHKNLIKTVSLGNFITNFTDKPHVFTRQIDNIDLNRASKKASYKETKIMYKPQQSQADNTTRSVFIYSNEKMQIQNYTIKDENITRSIDGAYALRLQTSNNDSVPAKSIQLSQTYSRQSTNMPQHKPTSSSYRLKSATKHEKDEKILQQLANDVKKVLLTSVSNNTKPNENGALTTPAYDPFLIAVYDENSQGLRVDMNSNDDLQPTVTSTKTPNSMESGRNTNSSIHRMDHIWTVKRRKPFLQPTVKTYLNRRIQNKFENKAKTKAKSESYNGIKRIDKTTRKESKLQVNNNNNSSSSRIISNGSGGIIEDIYYKWFNKYAEKNRKHGRTLISEHFRKVKSKPNIT